MLSNKNYFLELSEKILGIDFVMYSKPFAKMEILHEVLFFRHKAFNCRTE